MDKVSTQDQNGTDKPSADGIGPSKNAKPATPDNKHGTDKRKHTWLEKFAVVFAALAFGASAWQGWIIRDQEKRQLRAYLAFHPNAGIETNDGKQFGVHFNCLHPDPTNPSVNDCREGKDSADIMIRNFGVTPALHPETCIYFQHAHTAESYDVKSAFELAANGCGRYLQRIRAISPTESVSNSAFLTAETLNALQRSAEGDGVTFLISTIAYTDVFGDRHRAHLCGILNGKIGAHAAIDCGGRAPEDY